MPPILNMHCSIKATNLPSEFMEMCFKSHIEKLRLSKSIAPEMSRAIVRFMYYARDHYAVIEFPTMQIAIAMAKLKTTVFHKVEIGLECALHDENTVFEDDMTVANLTAAFNAGVDASTPTKKSASTFLSPPPTDTSNESVTSMLQKLSPFKKSGQVVEPSVTTGTKVRVVGLPQGCDLDLLEFRINKEVVKAFNLEKKAECVVSIQFDGDNIAVLELVSKDWAEHLCGMQTISVEGTVAHIEPYAVQLVPDDKSKVKVTGLKIGFDMDLLEFLLNKEVVKAFNLEKKAECIISASLESDSSAVFELISKDWAEHLCGMQTISFEGTLAHIEPYTVQFVPDDKNKVKATGLKIGFDMDLLEFVLNKEVVKAFNLERKAECIISCSPEGDSSAVFEFVHNDWAEHLWGLGSITFDGNPISLSPTSNIMQARKINNNNYKAAMPVTSHSEKTLKKKNDGGIKGDTVSEDDKTCDISQVVNVDFLADSVSTTKMKPASYLIKSEDGKVLFLQKLLLTRSLFLNSRNYTAGYARLLGELRAAGVEVDMKELNVRRKYWLDIHNNAKRGTGFSRYENVLRVIFDGDNIETLAGTKFELEVGPNVPEVLDPAKVGATAAMFSKGACFTEAGAKYLIKVVRTNFESFLNASNRDLFWREVANIINVNRHYGDGHACERKFQTAKKLYRDHAATQKNQTGLAGPEMATDPKDLWFWNEDMHIIMEKDNIVNPPLTFNAGSSNLTTWRQPTLRSVQDSETSSTTSSYQNVNPTPVIQRSRVPQLKRPQSKRDEMKEIMREAVQAMNRRTDVIAQTSMNSAGAEFRPEDEDEEEERRRVRRH